MERMPREAGLAETIARPADLSPAKVLHVLDSAFRKLHRRTYEYEGVNGDYICEELSWELSERAWIQLYFFLILHKIKYSNDHPDDVMSKSTIQLQNLGESERWQPYVDETKEWKMSRHLRDLWSHEVEP